MATYIAEPFKIKMVEPIKMTTTAERIEKLKAADYNLFSLRAEDIYIDLQTDSGTGAMSHEQWAGVIKGDESYSGGRSYFRVIDAVQDIFAYAYAQPVHQGRAAEKVLLPIVIKPGQYSISNMHFDTTRAHVELAGGKVVDCVCQEALDLSAYAPFKGNMDVVKLERYIQEFGAQNVGVVIMTITNNSAGGQPVSVGNIKATAEVCRKYGIRLMIDAARFAENAYFVKTREPGYQEKSIAEIVKEMFSYADAFAMSAKKDAIVNMGGLIGVKNDETLFNDVKARTIPYEGFVTYGGLSGRDLEALAIGLYEGINVDYLRYRIGQIEYLGEKLREAGVPFQSPVGGHAVFVDAKALLPQIPYDQFPAQALSCELYIEAGIRGGDIGSFMMGNDPETGKQLQSEFEFCRLAVPRRVYTQAHLDVVADALTAIKQRAHTLKGYAITWEPKVLRHFTAKLRPLA